MNDLRIVFMGTPEFAVPSLDKLVQAGYNIVGVITAPDKPAGRGMQLQQSAIKKFAVEKGLKILQPEKLKSQDFLQELKELHADLQIVVAFRMLPEVVWNMPPMGTINLHASLLPQYRGAAPINRAIINGEKETGATTFKLQHQIDTGDILLQQKINIGKEETAGELHDRMKEIGAAILGNLDDDGYLVASVEEIAAMGEWPVADVERALQHVQTFDPIGVAARDLQECLWLQIRHLGLEGTPTEKIVTEHLRDRKSTRLNSSHG